MLGRSDRIAPSNREPRGEFFSLEQPNQYDILTSPTSFHLPLYSCTCVVRFHRKIGQQSLGCFTSNSHCNQLNKQCQVKVPQQVKAKEVVEDSAVGVDVEVRFVVLNENMVSYLSDRMLGHAVALLRSNLT